MKRLETKYRVFKVTDAPGNNEKQHNVVLENCSHIDFEVEEDAEEWIMENGNFRTSSHDYVIMPCIRVIREEEASDLYKE